MIEFVADLPDWLWAVIALYFAVSAASNGLGAYADWLEFQKRREAQDDRR